MTLPRVLDTVTELGLRADAVHMHLGWGLTEGGETKVRTAFERLAAIARAVPGITAINVGGGLGGRYVEHDHPLALGTWAGLIAELLAPVGASIWCEPGTFVSASSGMLVVEANTIEARRGETWLGVNAGFAVNLNAAMYNIGLTAIALQQPHAASTQSYTIAGNINESVTSSDAASSCRQSAKATCWRSFLPEPMAPAWPATIACVAAPRKSWFDRADGVGPP